VEGVDTVAFGGAIVARASKARIANCTIRGSGCRNDQAVGLLAQEGSDLAIEFNEIVDHSTAVALVNDARAVMRNNLMEGPRSETASVGLSIQCNAVAVVERNLMSRFSSGLWAFGEGPTVTFEGNIIETMRDRGIDAGGRGETVRMTLRRNVLYQCGWES
jgi:nitrous oxidase accessory protein NosD